jgi:1,4-dihydroxy-2-naphthoate polyprenyltransferase
VSEGTGDADLKRRTLYFIRLGRPLFLVGGLVLHALGIAVALYAGAAIRWPVVMWGQAGITAVQWMTHYSNDYFDLAADKANRTPSYWSGGSRILPAGLLPPWVALWTALLLAIVAVAAALVLTWVHGTGPLTLPLFLLALFLGWSYSGPPLRLHARGWGEVTSAILVSGLTPLVGFYLQAGRYVLLPFLAVVPLCFFQVNVLLAVHFSDAASDALVGKRTLVVRLGPTAAARLYVVMIALAYLSLPLLVWAGLPRPIAVAAGLTAPVGAWQARRMLRRAWAEAAAWSSIAFWSIALLLGTAGLEIVTCLWLTFAW